MIAVALGRDIKVRNLPGGRRGFSVVGEKRILVASGSYLPRIEYSIAHELAEGEILDRLPGAMHERFCERVAAAVLLPATEFVSALFAERFDLAKTRERWPWASWEAALWRSSELIPGLIAAKWHEGRLLKRRGDKDKGAPTAAEFMALGEAMLHGSGERVTGGVRALAWRLPRGKTWVVSLAMPE